MKEVMNRKIPGTVLMLMVTVFAAQALMAAPTEIETVKAALKNIIKVEPDNIQLTPVEGLYEVSYGSKIVYMTKDGNYLIEGDVYDIKKGVNLTENVRQVGRKKVIDSLDPKHEIVFSPKSGKADYVITAFTDIDCGYCRKLHKEIKQYNDLGIEMRYVAFPRSGPKTESYYKAVGVWCAKDRNKAMTFAKGGASLEQIKTLEQVANAKECEDAVNQHLSKAREIGISGTPTLFMENGQIIPGYVPAERLLQMLKNGNV